MRREVEVEQDRRCDVGVHHESGDHVPAPARVSSVFRKEPERN